MNSIEPLNHFERFGIKPAKLRSSQVKALADFKHTLDLACRYRHAFFNSEHVAHKSITHQFFERVDKELAHAGLPRFEVVPANQVPNLGICRTLHLLKLLYPDHSQIFSQKGITGKTLSFAQAQEKCERMVDEQIARMRGYLRLFESGHMLYGSYTLQGFEPA